MFCIIINFFIFFATYESAICRILQALFIGLVMAFLYDYPIGKDGGCILDDSNSTSSNSGSNSTGQEDDFGLNSKTQDNIAFIFFITLFTVMAVCIKRL